MTTDMTDVEEARVTYERYLRMAALGPNVRRRRGANGSLRKIHRADCRELLKHDPDVTEYAGFGNKDQPHTVKATICRSCHYSRRAVARMLLWRDRVIERTIEAVAEADAAIAEGRTVSGDEIRAQLGLPPISEA